MVTSPKELAEILETVVVEVEPPDFQRFVAVNIFVVGQNKQRHRVTITNSLRDLAQELSFVLPNRVQRILKFCDELIIHEESRHEIPARLPRWDPFVAVCSCGQRACEHVEVACRHFNLVQSFADNTGQILEEIHKRQKQIEEAVKAQSLLETKLQQLNSECATLAEKLAVEKAASERANLLQEQLTAKQAEISELQNQVHHYGKRQEELEKELAIHQDNYRAIVLEVARRGSEFGAATEREGEIDEDVQRVLYECFLPPVRDVAPERRLQLSVSSDYHMAASTRVIAANVAQLFFVREIGIDRRLTTKTGKVQILPKIGELKLIVPRDGDANTIRVYTTAQTRSQHYFAAHLLAQRFGVEVQDG